MRLKDITCISDIYYVIGRWFTVIMTAAAFMALPLALSRWDSVLSFLACAGIAFVGAAANYMDSTEYPVHFISASVSAVCSVVWVACMRPWLLLVLLLSLAGLIDRRRWLLWCEAPCFLMFYLALFI